MKIRVGTHRIVFVFRTFVVKFPRIWNPIEIIKSFSFRFNLKKVRLFLKYDIPQISLIFLEGILENWDEYHCYQENADKLSCLMPTNFSLAGLMNVQRRCAGKNISKQDVFQIRKRIYEIMESDFWEADSHTLLNNENYFKLGGSTKLVDYGSLRKFIKKRGKEFEEILNQK